MDQRLACVLFGLAAVYVFCNWFVISNTHKRQAVIELRHQELAGRLVDVVGNVSVIRKFH